MFKGEDSKNNSTAYDEIQHIKEELQFQLEHDPLTKLYNRKYFCEYVTKLLKENADEKYLILTWDIEHFKIINELYGMEEGNRVLQKISRWIENYVWDLGVSGHLEADHFAACVPVYFFHSEQFVKLLQKQVVSDRIQYRLSVYCGIYEIEDINMPADRMCDRANLALQTVKGNFLKKYAYYDSSMQERMLMEQNLVTQMQDALHEHQFIFYLQPIYSSTVKKYVGAEALIRWNHPTRGILAPGLFLPLAENNGFISEIDRSIWEQVCSYQRERKERHEEIFPISINISRNDFYVMDICEVMEVLVEKYELERDWIKLEITESAYMNHPKLMLDAVEKLKQKGYQLLLDDFGSEYSSLNMLKDILVDTLKIDMRFLMGFRESDRAANVVASVVRMAKWLNMKTIAEGVETKEQLDFLHSIGCDYFQGYYFSRPIPTKEFEVLFSQKVEEEYPEEIVLDDINLNSLFADPNVDFLFENIFDGVSIWEISEGRAEVIRANEAYCEILQLHPAQVYQETEQIFWGISQKEHQKFIDCFKRARIQREIQKIVLQRHVEQQENLCLECKIRYLGSKGVHAVYLIVIRDVTEYF